MVKYGYSRCYMASYDLTWSQCVQSSCTIILTRIQRKIQLPHSTARSTSVLEAYFILREWSCLISCSNKVYWYKVKHVYLFKACLIQNTVGYTVPIRYTQFRRDVWYEYWSPTVSGEYVGTVKTRLKHKYVRLGTKYTCQARLVTV